MDVESAGLNYVWASILGVVQGLTEFLPVSSSGHLALVEHLGAGVQETLAFDLLLHLATLLAVLIYFNNTLRRLWKSDRTVLLYVLVATVPTGVIGMLFKGYFEALRFSPTIICIGLLVTACALSFAELARGGGYRIRDLGLFGAFFVGFTQALALTPGISRSGSTISAAMLCGVNKEEAFNFSFILSIPTIGGAAFLQFVSAMRHGGLKGLAAELPLGPSLLGFLLSGITGYFSLVLLKRLVVGGKLVWFAAYCFAAGATAIFLSV